MRGFERKREGEGAREGPLLNALACAQARSRPHPLPLDLPSLSLRPCSKPDRAWRARESPLYPTRLNRVSVGGGVEKEGGRISN